MTSRGPCFPATLGGGIEKKRGWRASFCCRSASFVRITSPAWSVVHIQNTPKNRIYPEAELGLGGDSWLRLVCGDYVGWKFSTSTNSEMNILKEEPTQLPQVTEYQRWGLPVEPPSKPPGNRFLKEFLGVLMGANVVAPKRSAYNECRLRGASMACLAPN